MEREIEGCFDGRKHTAESSERHKFGHAPLAVAVPLQILTEGC